VRRETGPLRAEVVRLEEEVAAEEARLAGAEAALADPGTYADPSRATALARERAEAERRVAELTARWEQAAGSLEEKERLLRDEAPVS